MLYSLIAVAIVSVVAIGVLGTMLVRGSDGSIVGVNKCDAVKEVEGKFDRKAFEQKIIESFNVGRSFQAPTISASDDCATILIEPIDGTGLKIVDEMCSAIARATAHTVIVEDPAGLDILVSSDFFGGRTCLAPEQVSGAEYVRQPANKNLDCESVDAVRDALRSQSTVAKVGIDPLSCAVGVLTTDQKGDDISSTRLLDICLAGLEVVNNERYRNKVSAILIERSDGHDMMVGPVTFQSIDPNVSCELKQDYEEERVPSRPPRQNYESASLNKAGRFRPAEWRLAWQQVA
ncbi:hypothetical protein ACWFOS_01480 [Gordonia terrae]